MAVDCERLKRRLQAPMGFCVTNVDQRVQELLGASRKVVNVGAKDTGAAHWINMDIHRNSEKINLVGDALHMPFADAVMDGAVLKFVLEHVRSPQRVVEEVYRALRPGGLIFITVPFVEPFHADPHDFQRFTLDGLKELCGAFHILEAGAYYGPASALVELLREFAASFFDTPLLKKGVRFLAGWVFLPIKYMDVLLKRKRGVSRCAYGVYLLGRRPGTNG